MDSVLCVVAHPDDETRLAGGLIVHLARQGVAVHILCLTRGEGGELGEPPLATRETLGAVREQEAVCAARLLGARSLTFLDYIDPEVGADDTLHAPDHDPVMLAGQIANAIQQFQVQAVLTHGSDGEYGHPAHVLAYQMTLAAVMAREDAAPVLYSFAAMYPDHPYPRLANESDAADFVLDVTAYLQGPVLAATECHRTQQALFTRRMSVEAGRPVGLAEVVARLPREGVHRHWPADDDHHGDVFLDWLRRGETQ